MYFAVRQLVVHCGEMPMGKVLVRRNGLNNNAYVWHEIGKTPMNNDFRKL